MTTPATIVRTVLLLAFAVVGLTLGGCSTAPVVKGDVVEEPIYSPEAILHKDEGEGDEGAKHAGAISDPWEGFNRTMYRFNYHFDKYIFLPAVHGYQLIMPDIAQQGFHNFFNNVRELNTLINSGLQARPDKVLDSSGRLLINTTVGLLGLIDWATPMGIPAHQEDFGQTMGRWGVGSGPYLVLPVLGPSSVRDGIGLGVDTLVRREIRSEVTNLSSTQELVWDTWDAVDTRAHIAFRYYRTGSPFEYEWVRLLFTTKRQLDIEK